MKKDDNIYKNKLSKKINNEITLLKLEIKKSRKRNGKTII
jgi:hypothetical protein